MTDMVSAFAIGSAVMAMAILVGRFLRGKVHAILPFNDPVWVFSAGAEIILLLVAVIVWEVEVPTLLLLVLAGGNAGYLLGYCTAKQSDVVYLDLPSDDLSATTIGPMVQYVHGGCLYTMPQSLPAIVASFLGARHPLDMQMGGVAHARTVKASSGIMSLCQMTVYPVAIHQEERMEVGILQLGSRKLRGPDKAIIGYEPRYLRTVEVTSHYIRFSKEMYDDPLAWYTKAGVYKTAIVKADEAVERATRLEIQMQSATFDAGASVVAGLISLQEDAPGTRDDILDAVRAERARRQAAGKEVGDAEDLR